MAEKTIATISGTMLVPGVSTNRRLYTPALIEKAVARMRARLNDPDGLPIVMRTFHGAGDDSRLIVGALTDVHVDEAGRGKYTAALYDTAPARDIAALVTPAKPALRSVSVHGYWLGKVKRTVHEGQDVTTADDLEIDAVDFTANPGVRLALTDTATTTTTESASDRTPISETSEATVETIVETSPEPSVVEYSTAQKKAMLDKGQAMENPQGEPSYPIKTKADLRKAIRAVGRGNADHGKIRAHIIARAKALGLMSMIPDNWNQDGSMKETTSTRYGELREYYPDGPSGGAGFCIDAYNGPLSITLRSATIDPSSLRAVAAAAMTAAVDALQAMDPDMDADIDIPGAPAEDTDGDTASMETAPEPTDPVEPAPDPAPEVEPEIPALVPEPDPPAPIADPEPPAETDTTSHKEDTAVAETTPAVDTAAPTRTLTDADVTAIGASLGAALSESLTPILSRLAEKVTETAPEPEPVEETAPVEEAVKLADVRDMIVSERARIRDELREELLRDYGRPTRKGFRVHENAEPDAEEIFGNRADILLGEFGKTPVPVPGTGTAVAS